MEPDNTTARGLTLNGTGATIISGNCANNNLGNTLGSAFTLHTAVAVVTLSSTNTYTGATALTSGTSNVNSTTASGGTASTVALNGVTFNNTSGTAYDRANTSAVPEPTSAFAGLLLGGDPLRRRRTSVAVRQ